MSRPPRQNKEEHVSQSKPHHPCGCIGLCVDCERQWHGTLFGLTAFAEQVGEASYALEVCVGGESSAFRGTVAGRLE
jgi:hypothetical protein